MRHDPRSPASTVHTLADTSQPHPTLDIVIPVYNEQDDIVDAVRRLDAHLRANVPYPARITVADNASTDGTVRRAVSLTESVDGLRVVHLDEKGRGRALNAVWRDSDTDIVAYCDVDLSTDLNALMPLIAPLISGHSDIAIGSRLSNGSRVERGMKREFISRSYNLILRTAMRARFSDAQCGFRRCAPTLPANCCRTSRTPAGSSTPNCWSAERIGLRIAEVPVDWIDDPNSSVDIVATAVADLKGCARVGRALVDGTLPVAELRASMEPVAPSRPARRGRPVRIVRSVGAVLCGGCGVDDRVRGAVPDAALAVRCAGVQLCGTGYFGGVQHRGQPGFSFGVRGTENVVKHQVFGLGIFMFGWVVTAGSLFVLHAWVPGRQTS